jgi:hypothetical protein
MKTNSRKSKRPAEAKTPRTAQRKGDSRAAHGSANNTNLWRRYRLTHVMVAWQERYGGHWYDYSKQIPHEDFVKRYSQLPPND